MTVDREKIQNVGFGLAALLGAVFGWIKAKAPFWDHVGSAVAWSFASCLVALFVLLAFWAGYAGAKDGAHPVRAFGLMVGIIGFILLASSGDGEGDDYDYDHPRRGLDVVWVGTHVLLPAVIIGVVGMVYGYWDRAREVERKAEEARQIAETKQWMDELAAELKAAGLGDTDL